MNNNISTLWSNPHLRFCAVLLLVIEIAAIWLPQFKSQLDATKSVVLLYALAASANSAPPSKPSAPPTLPEATATQPVAGNGGQ
jgi:hypothetical protein